MSSGQVNPPDVQIRYAGPSSDWRTNRWTVTCSCGKSFEPPTTMRSKQSVICPKCGREILFDYNALPESVERSKK
jgi:RNase P subunit RPR2